MLSEWPALRQAPIGTEHEIAGHIFVKTKLQPKGRNKLYANAKYGTYCKPYWIPKEELIYTKAFGEIPADYRVVFIDGNKKNYDLMNLVCIHNDAHKMMLKNKWYGKGRELTMAAINLCELTKDLNYMRKSADERNINTKKACFQEMHIFRNKYYRLRSELPEVFTAIDNVLQGAEL